MAKKVKQNVEYNSDSLVCYCRCSSKMKECLSDQSSLFLPDLSELCSVDETSTPYLNKFVIHLSICLKVSTNIFNEYL